MNRTHTLIVDELLALLAEGNYLERVDEISTLWRELNGIPEDEKIDLEEHG